MLDKYNSNDLRETAFCCLEEMENNFSKIDDVETKLLYGTVEDSFRPFLSLIIPTYRRTEFLVGVGKHVKASVDRDFLWEVVVIDNTLLDMRE